MKTLNEYQTASMDIKSASTLMEATPRPKIGDDDGISNRAMNMLIVLFTLLTLGISIVSAVANDGVKYRILLRQAMLDMDRLEFDQALVKLLEVRANTGENANVNHMLGMCYLYGPGSAEKAAFYLSKAASSISSDYQEWDLDETHAPVQTVYHLAMAYEQIEDFGRAADSYRKYLALTNDPKKDNTSRTYAIINEKAARCELAAERQIPEVEVGNVVFNK